MTSNAAAAWLALSLTGCVSVSWSRDSAQTPPAKSALEALRPGETDLATALALLGAPLEVWEDREGAALAWGWLDGKELGLNVSVPIAERTSASLDVNRLGAKTRGVVLFFDASWRMSSWRRGYLRELRDELRRARPQPIDDEPPTEKAP